MIRATLILCLVAGSMIAAQEPRAVAEAALIAWRNGNPMSLNAIAHPELKEHCRKARLTLFYTADKPEKRKVLVSGSDFEVIELLCEALSAIVPSRDARLEYFDYYLDTTYKSDLAIVSFDSGWKRKSDGAIGNRSKQEIVLKKNDGEWKFLWSGGVSVHCDLSWDPRE